MDSFANQTAVVTGAGGTLCSVIAEHLARRGCKVVLVGRTEEKLLKTAAKIDAFGGKYMIAPCDVTDEAGMTALAAKVLGTFGPCRFLINGAGGNNIKAMTTNFVYDERELTADKPEDMRCFFDIQMPDFESVLKINTMGTVIAVKAFAPQMIGNGGGAVLNFASMNSYRPLTRVLAYAMSKAAICNLTQWLATYFAPAKVRVNAVAPGFFVNERSKQYLGTVEEGLTQRGKNVISHTPQGRFGEPEDLLGTVDYLLDDALSSFVTGITVPVDGGFLSHSGI